MDGAGGGEFHFNAKITVHGIHGQDPGWTSVPSSVQRGALLRTDLAPAFLDPAEKT